VVARRPFEDPGARCRASAHGIEEDRWGQARFREFLPLTLPVELSISPVGAREDILSPAEVMCGDNSSSHHPPQVWGRQGLPQTPPPLEVLSISLHCPLPPARRVPLCHPGLSPTLPTQAFTLTSFNEHAAGGHGGAVISPPLKGEPSQNPGQEAAEFRDRTEVHTLHILPPSSLGNCSSGPEGKREGRRVTRAV